MIVGETDRAHHGDDTSREVRGSEGGILLLRAPFVCIYVRLIVWVVFTACPYSKVIPIALLNPGYIKLQGVQTLTSVYKANYCYAVLLHSISVLFLTSYWSARTASLLGLLEQPWPEINLYLGRAAPLAS